MSTARKPLHGLGSTAAPSPEPLGIFGPASALALLWEKASPAMDTRTLQWFADGAGNQVATQAMYLSGWLDSLACLVSQDHTVGSFQSAESTGGCCSRWPTRSMACAAWLRSRRMQITAYVIGWESNHEHV